MKNRPRGRSRFHALAITLAAAIVTALVAVPAVASAAASLSLSIEPAVPPKGKPFQMIAKGTAESPGGQSDLTVYFTPGTRPCASTAALEEANSTGLQEIIESRYNPNGEVFDKRGTYSGEPFVPYSVKSGLVTGHYRACGYLSDTADGATLVTTRLEFTAGGTCDSATAKVAKAEKQLKKAKKKLKKAKQSGDSTKIKKAKKKVKKAKKKLKAAKADREALC